MARVVISGYYGFHNLGDEAILYSMLQALRRELPGIKPVVLSADPAHTARAYGVEAVNRWRPAEVVRALRSADLLISGGGSLLQDVTGLKSLIYYLGVIWLARLAGRPVVFYAQGIGPVNSRSGRALVARAAGRACAVTVRDEESRDDLRSMGVKNKVLVTADPVLGLDAAEVLAEPGLAFLQEAGVELTGGPLVGISVRPWHGEGWVPALAAGCDRLVQNGARVVLLPMQHPADLQVAEAVARSMQEKAVVLRRRLPVTKMLALVKNLDLLVGMRLHALIFAALFAVPPVGISYDPKVERFLGQLGIDAALEPGALTAGQLFKTAEEALELDRENLRRKVAVLRRRALESARVVHSCLKGEFKT